MCIHIVCIFRILPAFNNLIYGPRVSYLIFPELFLILFLFFYFFTARCSIVLAHAICGIPWEGHNNHTPRVSGNLSSPSSTSSLSIVFALLVILVVVNVLLISLAAAQISREKQQQQWQKEKQMKRRARKKNIKQKEQLIFFTTRFFTVVSCFFSLFFLFNFLLIFSNCLPRAAPYRHWFAVVCFCCCYYRCCCCCFIYYCRRLVRFWHLHFHSFSSYSHFIFLSRLVRPTCPGKWKHDQKQIVKRHAAYT